MQKMTYRITHALDLLAYENHDHCIKCGYGFKESDTAHLGYDRLGNPLYVCDSCSNELAETAIRRYYSPHPYDIPEQNSSLWRYMDFTKYASMLVSSGLYFSRSDLFDDKFEGAKGLRTIKNKWDEYYLSFFKYIIRNPPEKTLCDKSDETIDKEAKELLDQLEAGGINNRKYVFINCWHENTYESEAMWRLYSSYFDNAIAIRTTFKSLYESLGKNTSIAIGRVKYIDFNKSFAGANESFWRKRKSFEHEKEVRAVTHDLECKEVGKMINCNLNILLEDVIVSPNAPKWFIDLVKDINIKYGYTVNVSQSSLNDEPFY
jgi:hypothetical protein